MFKNNNNMFLYCMRNKDQNERDLAFPLGKVTVQLLEILRYSWVRSCGVLKLAYCLLTPQVADVLA